MERRLALVGPPKVDSIVIGRFHSLVLSDLLLVAE
jgi:hypothetical protein